MKTYYWFCLFSLLLIGATLDSPIAFCEEPAFQIQASSYHSDHLNDASDEFPNDYESFVIPIENSKHISVSPLITCTSLENDTWQPQYHPCKLAQTILVDDDWSDKNASFTYIFEDWTDFDWNDVIVDLHASKLNGICSYLYLSFREAAWKNPFSLEITAEGTWIELKWSSTDYPNINSTIIGQGETIEINLFSESNPGDTASVEFLVPPVALFSWYPIKPIVGETVIIDASGSYDPDKSIETYSWALSEGRIINTRNKTITHVFTSPGICTINLTVVDSDGLKNMITRNVEVLAIIGGETTAFDCDFLTIWVSTSLLLVICFGAFAVLMKRRDSC